jgi:hypothetical protein
MRQPPAFEDLVEVFWNFVAVFVLLTFVSNSIGGGF